MEAKAIEIEHVMQQIKGVKDLGIFRLLGQPNLLIQVDREASRTLWTASGGCECCGAGRRWRSGCDARSMKGNDCSILSSDFSRSFGRMSTRSAIF